MERKHILVLMTAGIVGLAILIFSIPTNDVAPAKSPCRIIYDAGSSGTRLFIYQKQNGKWLEHEGPKVSALADPVREIRGKKWSDVDAVINEVANTLDHIQTNGPGDKTGQPKWLAFNWPTLCNIVSANIYATAGMRIAEQQNKDKSVVLWRKLKQKLTEKLGKEVSVDTRTLTGFEEGLYAWLSVRNSRTDNNFGIVEMGGASSQVTFPCINCPTAKIINFANQQLKVFSYSFLGLGTNEAPKTIGMTPACAYGVGAKSSTWTEDNCASSIRIKAEQGIRDPYNFGDKGRGTFKVLPIQQSGITQWVLTGAF